MSLRTLLTTVAVALAFVLTALAADNETESIDPKCPRGTYSGFSVNTFQYNVSQTAFDKRIGSFLDAVWYTGPVNSTQGEDKTAGAVRTATFSGTTYTERLVEYIKAPGKFSMRYVLSKPAVLGGVRAVSYTEELSAISICSGNATYIVFSANYCAEKPNAFGDFYDRSRRSALGAIAEELHAGGFPGSCTGGMP